ncbi:MAG: MBL fold metallo-hydrolase [Alphaproteobacteria bacterium]|nr:MBL fold metallo-hydrolase [Alphaproteobacteria bacterium]MDP7428523.1 MBL fold metallo-hydrolase [Alphaproteobacteria bacterium]
MTSSQEFSVRFWGVRGSVACFDPSITRYGGNTSSLEVWCGDQVLLLDAGTGMRYLGQGLDQSKPIEADIFLTHTHFDHVCGLPFFGPFFNPANHFKVWAGHLVPEHTIQQVISDMMIAPLFPVPPEIFAANVEFCDFKAGETMEPRPGITLKTLPLNHPNRATGYRVEFAGRSFCYVTDTEHVQGETDENILEFIKDADVVAYDGMYTDDEFPKFISFGHSTWQEGLRLCQAAEVKKYVLFHHEPNHDDDFLDAIGEELERLAPGSVVAREGLVLEI